MPRPVYICGGEDTCPKHGIRKYAGLVCHKCQDEWEAENPLHEEAIARFARGEGSVSDLRRALDGPGKVSTDD